jgi:hypothetical protein
MAVGRGAMIWRKPRAFRLDLAIDRASPSVHARRRLDRYPISRRSITCAGAGAGAAPVWRCGRRVPSIRCQVGGVHVKRARAAGLQVKGSCLALPADRCRGVHAAPSSCAVHEATRATALCRAAARPPRRRAAGRNVAQRGARAADISFLGLEMLHLVPLHCHTPLCWEIGNCCRIVRGPFQYKTNMTSGY